MNVKNLKKVGQLAVTAAAIALVTAGASGRRGRLGKLVGFFGPGLPDTACNHSGGAAGCRDSVEVPTNGQS